MSDASPTFRGFRKQFVYILWRVLCDEENDNLVYQPEHIEDLAIYEQRDINSPSTSLTNQALSLRELVQVKDYSAPLRLSNFNIGTNSKDSFFHRISSELSSQKLKASIASYGPFGDELIGALTNDVDSVNRIVCKLTKKGISKDLVFRVLESTEANEINYECLCDEILSRLSEGPTSPDPQCAFDLLIKWIYDCCETKEFIDKQKANKKINSVGAFIEQRQAHASEWGTAISCIEEQLNIPYNESQLLAEYLEGMDASLLHIFTDCDVIRDSLLNEIHDKFSKANIVIIHGASGQGKSSLAYRYIYEFYPLSLCFEIKNIADSQHALSIARAINGYAKYCGELLLYVDVKPSHTGWDTLLDDLRHFDNIKILVTVREEDLHIANLSPSFSYEGIHLCLDEDEAKKIYEAIPNQRIANTISSFDNAWELFGGTGPLLEFIHLVTQGGNLESRICSQIDRIHDLVTQGHRDSIEIDILRLVSVASAFEASCDTFSLMNNLEITSSRVFRKLEDEYLIKQNDNTLSGLHSIRSEIVLNLLCENQQLLAKTICDCLPLINDGELYLFLLHAFTRCPDYTNSILDGIEGITITSWLMANSIIEALLWLGVRGYVEENTSLLEDLYAKFKSTPAAFIDPYIADPSKSASMLDGIKDFITEDGVMEMRSFLSRQTDKSRIFRYCENWLDKPNWSEISISNEDFAFIGKICFWAARVKKGNPISSETVDLFLDKIPTIRTEGCADFMVGLFHFNLNFFNKVVEHRDDIIHKFKEETYTLRLKENEESVSINYLVPWSILNEYNSVVPCNNGNIDLNEESMYRIGILRKIFPDKKEFIAQGYGQNIIDCHDIDYFHDDSIKKIPIENLYLSWETKINGIFCNLSFFSFREKTWREYVDLVVSQRMEALQAMDQMIETAIENLCNSSFLTWFQTKLDTGLAATLNKKVEKIPLPQCSVDIWGFNGDSKVKGSRLTHVDTEIDELCSKYSEYTRTWDNVTNQFKDTIEFSTANKIPINSEVKAFIEDKSSIAHTCFENMIVFVENLTQFQKIFNTIFRDRFSLNLIGEIESNETEKSMQLLGLLNICIYSPERRMENPMSYVKNLSSLFDKLLKDINKLLNKKSNSTAAYRLVDTQGLDIFFSTQLWLSIDSNEIQPLFENIETVKQIMHDFLSSLSPLYITLLRINFSFINIVILYKGRLLQDSYFSFYLLSILQKGFPNLSEKSNVKLFEEEYKKKLRFESSVSVKSYMAHKFNEANIYFYAYLSHMKDINKLSECDDDMTAFCSKYINHIVKERDVLQDLFNSASEIFKVCNGFDEEELLKNPLIYQTMITLQEWSKIGIEPFWDFANEEEEGRRTEEFTLDFISEWADAYSSAHELGAVAVLFFSAAFIDSSS